MLQVAVPISLQNLEIWEKRHTCELVGNRKSPKRQKVFCSFADAMQKSGQEYRQAWAQHDTWDSSCNMVGGQSFTDKPVEFVLDRAMIEGR
jgi:hypothetical protein